VDSVAPISERRLAMRYVGLDVHKSQSSFCVLDENGKKVESRTLRGPWDRILQGLMGVKKPFAVCFEATTGYGYLHDRLKRMAERVEVAHPGQLRLIFRSKRKNDSVDAERLAKLLYLDEVPPVYVPPVRVREWRGLIEHRGKLLYLRTGQKNQVRALLRGLGITPPRGLWTRRGIAWLKALELSEWDQVRMDLLVEEILSLNEKMRRIEKVLGRIAEKHPGVQLLRTIPGVGIRTAEAVMAYIADPDRFHSIKSIGCYFGIVPCQDASAQKNRMGHITKDGPATVRRLVTEATWQAIRRSPPIRAYFERIRHGDSDRKKIALVATAHYLLRVMLAMLKSGEVWRSSSAA
jgi:transposase